MANGKRSAQEREAARLERERRRAARASGRLEGDPVVGDPVVGDPFNGGKDHHQDELHGDQQDEFGGDHHEDLDGEHQDELDGDHHDELHSDRHGEDGDHDDDLNGDHHLPGDHEDELEVPIGTRRVPRRERATRTRTRSAPRPPRPPRSPRRTTPALEGRFGRRRWLLGRLIPLLGIVPVLVAIWFLIEVYQPGAGSGHGRVTVTIPAHSSARHVGDLLARRGVIASGFFFDVRTLLDGDRGKLRAGTYTLKLDMSYSQVLKILTTPPPAAKVSELTIVEGRTRRQLDALLSSEGIGSGYFDATRHSPLLSPSQYGAPPGTDSLEGFLFPSTYQLRDPIQISALVADQLTTFRTRFGKVDLGYAASRHMSPYDVLIIASIVEKEAGTSHDFPLVASVIYNRLATHIPLGMDSTTRYEFNNYDKPLTQSQLAAPSPYNTRLHAGLPPTPIDSPGLPAIQAAAHPAPTNYLYFVVKPCGNGASVFTSSYSQFLQYQQQYYSARTARGGNSPTHC